MISGLSGEEVTLRTILITLIAVIIIIPAIMAQEKAKKEKAGLAPKTRQAVKRAIDRGVRFLRNAQNKQGHWGDIGITGLIVTALLQCPRKYGPEDGPWMRRPIEFVISQQKKDGGIYVDQLANYNTCVALMALTAHPQLQQQYRDVIAKARNFVLELQCDEGEGYSAEKDRFYGGIGYGGDERPDLSNTQFAIEALRKSGLPADDPALKKALIFLQRCQNRSESNDQAWAGNDGGFVYYPSNSPAGRKRLPDGKTGYRSYGGMTYAGLKSYIYANVGKDDPRVQAAYNWTRRNYDLTCNPGLGQQGLFYYYHTLAKTLRLLGIEMFIDAKDVAHNWREELAQVLLATQQKDGSWKNNSSRWWEAEPRLVTAYVILTLSLCYE